MDIEGDTLGVALLWLTFMTVAGAWVARIATLLYHQRLAERYYRRRLAESMGALVREARRSE